MSDDDREESPSYPVVHGEELKVWWEASCFGDILELNKRFLRGETHNSPYCVGDLDETGAMVPGLLALNDKKLLTNGCEPYIDKMAQGYAAEDDGIWYHCRQLPVVEFIMSSEDNPDKLFEELKRARQTESIEVYVREIWHLDRVKAGACTEEITIGKICLSDSRETLEESSWRDFASVHAAPGPDEDFSLYPAIKAVDPWSFVIIGTSWEEEIYLPGLLLKALENTTPD